MPDQDANATTARASEQESDVHRLRDIVVEEVSLVDRAANKRRFLVVKRSDAMSGQSGENGVEKAKKKPVPEDEMADAKKAKKKPDPDAEPDEAEKARRRAEDGEPEEAEKDGASEAEDEESKPRRKADLVLAADLKESLLATLTQAMERLMALAKQIKAAGRPGDGEGDDGLPDDLGSELEAVVELLGKVTKGGRKKAAKTEVAKGGARMGRDRLDRFEKALSLLSDILKELTASKEQLTAPTAGAAEAGVQKGEAQAGSPKVPGLTELVAGIGALTRVVKRQEDELARVRQTRGISNAIPVDGGGRRAEPQEVSWPLDMNRPISRDKVRKEVSFFDEV